MTTKWFAQALRMEMARRRLSQRGMAKYLGKGKSAVTQWLSGIRHPAFAELCEVGERLGWDVPSMLPPATRAAVEAGDGGDFDPDRLGQVYRKELLGLMADAIESEEPHVRHFAYAVLEDEAIQFSESQAVELAARLPHIAKDKRAYLSSHVVLVGTRLLNQTDAVIPLLGQLLVSSTNTLVRYRALAGFLDHPDKSTHWVHFVRSALHEGTIHREAYEMELLRAAAGTDALDGVLSVATMGVETHRQRKHDARLAELVNSLNRVTLAPRGEFAWYHALEAAGRARREGAALLMHAYCHLSNDALGKDSVDRRRDIMATINRAGIDAAALCADFLVESMRNKDPWIAFHSVAALGKWAPRDERIVEQIANLLASSASGHAETGTHVAPMCCFALAKIGIPHPRALSALSACRKSPSPWLRAVARVASDSIRGGAPIQDALMRMLQAA